MSIQQVSANTQSRPARALLLLITVKMTLRYLTLVFFYQCELMQQANSKGKVYPMKYPHIFTRITGPYNLKPQGNCA